MQFRIAKAVVLFLLAFAPLGLWFNAMWLLQPHHLHAILLAEILLMSCAVSGAETLVFLVMLFRGRRKPLYAGLCLVSGFCFVCLALNWLMVREGLP